MDDARMRFLRDRVMTASPAQRVVMLYDRLALDLRRAAEEADPSLAGPLVGHAASVVAELLGSLDLGAGGPAGNLANIYGYLLNELTGVRCTGDQDRLAELRPIVDSLREAFATAAATVASAASTSATAATAAIAVAGASVQPATAWVG